MFALAVVNILLGLAMIAGGIVIPVDAARLGLIVGGIALGLSGLFLAYLNAPGRREKPPEGMLPAKARILDGTVLPGSVAGYQMVELTLEVRPKDGIPFQAKRKFSAGRLGRIEAGKEIDVVYDRMNPDRVELP